MYNTFEDLKTACDAELIRLGFTKVDDNTMRKVRVQQHQMIVNGQSIFREEKIYVDIICLGEGFVDKDVSIGYTFKMNNHEMIDHWFTDPEDLRMINF